MLVICPARSRVALLFAVTENLANPVCRNELVRRRNREGPGVTDSGVMGNAAVAMLRGLERRGKDLGLSVSAGLVQLHEFRHGRSTSVLTVQLNLLAEFCSDLWTLNLVDLNSLD